jgi:hypothetical protein
VSRCSRSAPMSPPCPSYIPHPHFSSPPAAICHSSLAHVLYPPQQMTHVKQLRPAPRRCRFCSLHSWIQLPRDCFT